MRNRVFEIILCSLSFLAAGCSQPSSQSYQTLSTKVVSQLGCETFESVFWDSLKDFLIQSQDFPDYSLLSSQMTSILNESYQGKALSKVQRAELTSDILNLYGFLIEEVTKKSSSYQEFLLLISALDVGDRSSAFKSYMQDEIRGRLDQIKLKYRGLSSQCENSGLQMSAFSLKDFPASLQTTEISSLSTWGGRWTAATAYQSCQTRDIPPLNLQSEDVRGIVITGTHPDGVGSKRQIASLALVQSSHPYIENSLQFGPSCFNVRQNPLIYDYGGKPFATTSLQSTINMFRDNGSGTSVLGIDCSAFVFTAYATAGLKMKSGRPLKASDSWAWGSGAYVEPQKNGLTCLQKISVTPTTSLQNGDIVAVYGHVLILDRVGADPFGLRKISRREDCSKVSSQDFDFTVLQSSNSKGGVGINSFEGADYLETSPKFKEGLTRYAVQACWALFEGRSYTPNLGTLSVVRHSGKPECLGARVVLENESCLDNCQL